MAGVGRIPFSTPWLLTGLIFFAVLIVIAAATIRRRCGGRFRHSTPGGPIRPSPGGSRPAAHASEFCSP